MTIRKHTILNTISPVSTTDGTTITTVLTFDPVAAGINNCVFRVEGVLIGKDSSNNGTTCRVGGTFSNISDTVTLRGTVSILAASVGDAATSVSVGTLDVSSNTVRLRVTGVTATTITWTGWLEIWSGEI